MHQFDLIPARPYHCGQMARILFAQGHEATVELGVTQAHREMRTCFDKSSFRKAWLIDGKLSALGGVVGEPLGVQGYVWLALSDEARKYPVAMVKETKRQLGEIMRMKRDLAITILHGDARARRFALFLGFSFSHERSPVGEKAVTMRYRFREAA